MYPFMGQECTLQMTNRVEVLVLLCREVWVFLSRDVDRGCVEIHKSCEIRGVKSTKVATFVDLTP